MGPAEGIAWGVPARTLAELAHLPHHLIGERLRALAQLLEGLLFGTRCAVEIATT